MKAIGIIPARYNSTRLPGKPLIDIKGKPMIQRTYEQAKKASAFSFVAVATDDSKVEKAVQDFGGEVIMTAASHQTGTDRVCEAAEKLAERLELGDDDIVVNVQGDEPYIHPESLNLIVKAFDKYPEAEIVTLMQPITNNEDIFDSTVAKIVMRKNNEVIYFSRSPIPFFRDQDEAKWVESKRHIKHVGMYAFRLSVLKKVAKLAQTPLELTEKLEQLRWIENGYKIYAEETPHESFSIDTPEDLVKVDKFESLEHD